MCTSGSSAVSAGLETERGQESTAFILMRDVLLKINTTRINDLKLLICLQWYVDTVSLVPHCFEMLTFMTGITSGETIAVLLSLFILVKPFCQSESRRQSAIYSRCACLWHHYVRLLFCIVPGLEFSKPCQLSAEGRVEHINATSQYFFVFCSVEKQLSKAERRVLFPAWHSHCHAFASTAFAIFVFFCHESESRAYFWGEAIGSFNRQQSPPISLHSRLLQTSLHYGKSIVWLLFSLLCCRPICHCRMTA